MRPTTSVLDTAWHTALGRQIPADVPLHEEFDSTLVAWQNLGNTDWQVRTPAVPAPDSAAGNWVVNATNCDTTCTIQLTSSVDLSSYRSATFTMWRFVSQSLDIGECLRVEICDGASWSIAFDWSATDGDDDGSWYRMSYAIPSSHLGLPDNQTPAEAAGIKVEGNDKILTIIQATAKSTT